MKTKGSNVSKIPLRAGVSAKQAGAESELRSRAAEDFASLKQSAGDSANPANNDRMKIIVKACRWFSRECSQRELAPQYRRATGTTLGIG